MPPRNYQQTQPITTTLRSICASYSPSTCLRELLQNADDARASEIEYVLDSKTYTEGPFLHRELQDYHGPALLARNNSVFQESDFQSLSSVGDSGKQNDIASTGKFGQGFNSVFHWTDMPWVLSSDTLLFLDPHHRWSKEIGSPGGPAWNIVDDDCQEIRNHLATFAAYKGIEAGQALNETIIRIPLRNAIQASTSKIKEQATSVDDIKEVLSAFCQDVLADGLLFLKHIRRIIVRVDKEILLKASVLQDNSENTRKRNALPNEFLGLYASGLRGGEDMHRSFETTIQYENIDGIKAETYLVQSLMASDIGDQDLDAWARQRKLFPWVAVAAPVSKYDETFVGTLFSILRLPIQTRQPVHIHGLFALTPDRRGLSDQDAAPQWNRTIFQTLVASAWARLLVHRNAVSPQSEKFSFWPAFDIGYDIWADLDGPVLHHIIEDNLPVWNASQTCVDFDSAVFAQSSSESLKYADALAQIGLSSVYLEHRLFIEVNTVAKRLGRKFNKIIPKAVRSFLRAQTGTVMPREASCLLLEYCLSDAVAEETNKVSVFEDLNGVELFPTLDGKLAAPANLLLPRDQEEQETFSGARGCETIDLRRVSSTVRDLLMREITRLGVVMRHRGLKDLSLDWPLLYSQMEHGDDGSSSETNRPLKEDELLSIVWAWVLARYNENSRIPYELRSVWLDSLKDTQIKLLIELHAGLDEANLLEWDQGEIPSPILLHHLDYCIEHNEREKVDALLGVLEKADVSALTTRACVLGSRGVYLAPDRVFYPAHGLRSYPLSPYIDQVDEYYASKHKAFITALGIESNPSVEDLKGVQARLTATSNGALSSEDLVVAINTLEVGTRLHSKSEQLKDLLIPDTSSVLRDFMDIVHGVGDVPGEMAHLNFTHSDVPQSVVDRLGIEDAFQRAITLNIDFEDKDEDEFTPKEDLCTTIDDTLLRYSIDAIWNEFLSNADDAGGTKIAWTLDECAQGRYASKHLLDKKLEPFQGPALFSWNDAMFQEKDFEGFRSIGRGGKTDDYLSTGMFGRGALSMYHLTCLPQIVSAGSFLILDPQQHCLPLSRRHRKRKVGIKMSLAAIRAIAPDHLSVFDGIHGFHADLDSYEGTIFRFPLRTGDAKTGLQKNASDMSVETVKILLNKYLETARLSLLFLRNIISIEFFIRGRQQPVWAVNAQRCDNHEDEDFQSVGVSTIWGNRLLTDEWRLGITDIMPPEKPMVRIGKSSSKLIEGGVAARISHCAKNQSQEESSFLQDDLYIDRSPINLSRSLKHQIFCRLPTLETSQLPISFHGSFNITGDRKTISIEERDEVAHWNRWLLGEIADFYIDFLQYLASWIGEEAFQFWPANSAAADNTTLSGYVTQLFWSKVFNQKHKLDKLYPLRDTEHSRKNLQQNKARKARIIHKTGRIEDIYFDFLPEISSQLLTPLFALLKLPLVRPLVRLERAFRAASTEIMQVDSSVLTTLFKMEENCLELDKFLGKLDSEESKAKTLATLYEIITPKTDSKDQSALQALAGCRILARPGLDAPLGLLKVSAEGEEQTDWHYEATSDEQKLFSFAVDHMVVTKLYKPAWYKPAEFDKLQGEWRETVSKFSNSTLNVRKIRTKDIGFLLGLHKSPVRSEQANELRYRWTIDLWKYINRKFDSRLTSSIAESARTNEVAKILEDAALFDHAIYRASGSMEPQYLTPREFESLPCIVQPNDISLQAMCSKIPGLVCVDPRCLPTSLVKNEHNLVQPSGFARFLRALERIVRNTGKSAKVLLEPTIDSISRCALQRCLKDFLKGYPRAKDVPHALLIKSLPIWPRIERPENRGDTEYMAAEDASFCKHSCLFVPWAKNLHNFVHPKTVESYEDCLEKLGVHLWTPGELWARIEKHLPEALADNAAVKIYVGLVEYLQAYQIRYPIPLVPDGTRTLRKAGELYDHHDMIFEAAFRQEAEQHFLHPDARATRPFWVTIGLRTAQSSGELSEEDYLECALAVDRQWTANTWNQVSDQQAAGVASYLEFEKRGFAAWSASTWEKLSKLRIFSVKDNVLDMREYRQPRMKQLVNEHTYCSLQDAAQESDRAISWTQMKRLKRPPAAGVFAKLPQGGHPSIGKVYEHLQFLVGICVNVKENDILAYVGDLEACYHFLQKNTSAVSRLPGIQDAKVWLNIDTIEEGLIQKSELLTNFLPAKLICLDAPGSHLDMIFNIRVAKRFLMPFFGVLKAVGCQAVAPPVQRTPTVSDLSLADEWSTGYLELRDKEMLIDVVFEVQGQRLLAHKAPLAMVSLKWRTQFTGSWAQTTKHNAVVPVELDFKTFSTLLDFAYTRIYKGAKAQIDAPKEDIVAVVDDTLDVLAAADEFIMPRLHDQVETYFEENTKVLLRPWTVDAIMQRASNANARRLQEVCNDYIQRNQQFMELYREQAVEGEVK